MGPEKRTRRARVQRAVGSEKKPTRRRRKAVGDDAGSNRVTEPKKPVRRKAPPGPSAPYWKAAGLEPHKPDPEGES